MFQYSCLNPISEVGLKNFDGNYGRRKIWKKRTPSWSEARKCTIWNCRISCWPWHVPEPASIIFRWSCVRSTESWYSTLPAPNANGVKELVLAGMLLASRDIVGGVEWVKSQEDNPEVGKLAEKQKKQFAGCEISGKKLGIIGLGAIGQLVANSATHLGMDVYGYDPYLSVDAAWTCPAPFIISRMSMTSTENVTILRFMCR